MIRQPFRCYLCNRPINGVYYTDWAKNCICAVHRDTVKYCVSCGQFCNLDAKDIGLGMKVCTHCQKYNVTKPIGIDIAHFVKSIYRNTPIGDVSRWHFKAIDAVGMYKMCGDKNVRGLAQSVGTDYTVYVYMELSRVAFAQVLAHEVLHIYQYRNRISPPKAKCEGFCNLGSYIVLCHINNSEAKAAIEALKNNPDPIYGDGFRHMLSVYEVGGWNAAIREIKR